MQFGAITNGRFGRALGVVAALLLATAAPSQAEPTLSLRADLWCPYNCEPAATEPGVLIELAVAAFAYEGIRIDYKILPWTRALEQTRRGRIAGAVGTSVAEAPEFVHPRTARLPVREAFASKRARQIAILKTADLERYLVGAGRGYTFSPQLDDYITRNSQNPARVNLFSGDELQRQMLRVLELGRVDIVLDSYYVLKWTLSRTEGLDDLVLQPFGEPESVSIAFSPALPQAQRWADILDRGVVRLRQEGRFAAILRRYGLDPAEDS